MPSAEPRPLLAAPSTPSQPEETPWLPGLLGALFIATQETSFWLHQEKHLTNALTTLYELGQIADPLEHDGYTFVYSPGPLDYDYPPDVVALEAQLEEAKAAAVASKRATLKPSTPFWSVRKPRPAKDAQEAA